MGFSSISFEAKVLNTVLTGPHNMGLVVLTKPGGKLFWAWAMVLIKQNNDATAYFFIVANPEKCIY
jgi:hypothetical protein